MLHAHAPGVRPKFAERVEEARGREWDFVVADATERIEAKWLGQVGGIEVDEAIA
jgi:hypothetical protein